MDCDAVRRVLLGLLLCAALGIGGAAAETNAPGLTRPQVYARAAALQALGRRPVFRPVAFRLRPNGLCHLPRPEVRLRPRQCARRPTRRQGHARARSARRAVAQISAGGAAIHRALFRVGGRWRRKRRQRPDRRLDLGRPRRPPPRSGASAAALAVRNGQWQPRRRGRARAAGRLCRRVARDFRQRDFRRHRQGVRGGVGSARGLSAGLCRLLSLQQQIRRLSRRPRAAHAAGGARARTVQRSGQGQLRLLPHQRARQ